MSSLVSTESLSSMSDPFAQSVETHSRLVDIPVEGFLPSSAPEALISVFRDTLRRFLDHISAISRDADLQVLRSAITGDLGALLTVGDAASITSSGRDFLTRTADLAFARLDGLLSLRSEHTTVADLTRQLDMARARVD